MIGQTVSHYKIEEKLGEGGMGVVYKAYDTKLDRHIAIKLLSSQLSTSSEARQRFIREARAASSLEHPNICTIHEIDQTPDGRTFIVMPCYKGRSLDQLPRGSLGPAEAVDIVVQVAAGLAKAHQQGITHRDIKPGNIFLTDDHRAIIVDFGLAKLAGHTKLTRTGRSVGTAAYMSPEQVRGEEVGVQSDVFSLGIVLYELLTARLPFRGEHEPAMIYSILNQEPKPLESFREDLPVDLQRVIDGALHKDEHRRYKDASEFKTNLDLIAEGLKTTSFPRPEPPSRSWRISKELSPLRVAGLTAAVLVIIALCSWYMLGPDEGELQSDQVSLAVLDFTRPDVADDQVDLAGVMGLLQIGLVQNSPCRVVSPEYLMELRRRLFKTAKGPIGADQALEVARESGAKVLLSGQLASLGGNPCILWRLVDTENGENLGGGRQSGNSLAALADNVIAEVLFRLEALCDTKLPAVRRSVTAFTTESPEAYRHYVLGKIARDEYRIVDAVQELGRAIELDSTFALAYLEMSMAHYSGRSGGFNKVEAERFADKAWDLRERLGVKDRLRIEARQHQLNNRPEDAFNTYRTMLHRWPDDHETIAEFSELLVFNSRLTEARGVIKRGVELFPNDERLGGSYGEILFNSNQPGKALEVRRAHLKKFSKNPNEWDNLGRVYLQLGMPDSAETAFQKALQINSEFLWGQVGMGYAAFCRGDPETAIEIIENIIERPERLPGERIWLQLHSAFPLTYLYLDMGRLQDALGLFDSASANLQSRSLATRIFIEKSRFHLRLGRADFVEQLLKNKDHEMDLELWGPYLRAGLLLQLDSLDIARQIVEKYRPELKNDNRYTMWSILLASIELADEQPEKSLDVLEKMEERYVFQLGFNDIRLRELRAGALERAGRLEESADELNELLRIYGGHAIARYDLGRIYEQLGRFSEAAAESRKFLDMWTRADEGLPRLDAARLRVSALDKR